jgi:hypothetical protein
MEDKYFNEFFDKLYNGKLNIYEDEEEETSDEEVVNNDLDGDGEEENDDDNEQNYIIPKNPNYSLDELKKIIGSQSGNFLIKMVIFALENDYYNFNKSQIEYILNGFWELYGMENNKRDAPNWRKNIREGDDYTEGLKEYMKSYIEKNLSGDFYKRLIELYYQYIFLNKPTIDGIDVIINKNYSDLTRGFIRAPLNGFWELYGFESNNYKNPIWRKYIRKGDDYIEGFKKYIKSFLEKEYPNFEERLNKLFDQKGEGYEKTFTKEYDGKKYFEKIKIDNESRIHNFNPKEINISGIINNYVNSQIKNNSQYLTTELTNDDINYIKENLVDPVYNNIIYYLGNDENKVVSYDLECVQPLTNNGKTVIDIGEKIEVKDILKLDSYYSEYIASPVKKSTKIKTPKGKEIYKVFVENLLEKIKNDSSGTFDKIINDVYTNISGMIIADDIYVPKENITLYISSQGQRYGRFTLRYNINTEGDFYKIEKPRDNEDDGKINEPLKIRELKSTENNKLKPMSYVNPIYPKQGNVDESYDSYLDQLVENFFYTGKLFP